MAKHIAIIQGHPDAHANHYGHALAAEYAKSAAAAGHEVKTINVAQLDFPLLRSKEDFEHGPPPEAILEAQDVIRWADHLVILYPMWLGEMPALFKGFLEQVFRPGFGMRMEPNKWPQKLLKGKSARLVVTMGMPAFFYRWYFGAHGLKNLKRNILGFSGIGPIRESLIGMVETDNAAKRGAWLAGMRNLGERGA